MSVRSGFIFLYVLGLISVTLALALALLSTAQAARTGATKSEMDTLAARSAKEGVEHAMSVIRQEFLKRPGAPTQLSDGWRAQFWPIDADKVGYATAGFNDDAPTGKEFTAEDLFQNDVPVENGLTEAYLEVDNGRGTYLGRTTRYNNGRYNHPGLARWFEPGVGTNDPVLKPLSFHLPHPTPPNPASSDPAVVAGEMYAPDLDEPIWYDSELVATTDLAQRRYRLRYAVCIEDLSGHLLCTVPGEFDASATSVLSGLPSDVDRYKINEVDNSVADTYAGVLSNMFRNTSSRTWEWGDVGLRGLGATQQRMGYQLGYQQGIMLASRDSSGRMTYYDDADGGSLGPYYLPVAGTDSRINHESVMTDWYNPAHYFSVGPFPSFQALWYDADNVNSNDWPYIYTPFGRAPKKTTTPSAWYESRVDTPWCVNVPTLTPVALTTMIYSYMPDEFRTMGSDEKETKSWDAVFKYFPGPGTVDTAAPGPSDPPKFSATVHAVQLFDDMSSLAHFDQNGAVVPGEAYPGTRTAVPGTHWRGDLGGTVLSNTALGVAGIGILNGDSSYPAFGFSGETLLSQRFAGGVNVSLSPKLMRWDSWSSSWKLKPYNANGYDADAGYYYFRSYWLDLTASMVHALAVARYAWLDRVNGAHTSDPKSGKPQWPATMPSGYFSAALASGFAPGGLTRDRDVDGDGSPDVPSAFDTIAEIDHQFLRNLGEWPDDYPLGTRPDRANQALRSIPVGNGNRLSPPAIEIIDLDGLGSKNIKMLRTSGAVTLEQSILMELVVNDMRMSFFGASPDYSEFRPLDLNDDGKAACSCYNTGSSNADPATGNGAEPDTWFSLTGCFAFEKSRYYRIFTRGQLFDEIRGVPVAETNLETVYMVDPDGDMGDIDDRPAVTPGNGLADSHVLFQRRLNNRYLGTASHVDR